MATSRACVIVYVKQPKPGFAKTRLIPALGADGAAETSRQMAEHCIRRVDRCNPRITVMIEYASADADHAHEWFDTWLRPFFHSGRAVMFGAQRSGPGVDLGAKMATSFRKAFNDLHQTHVLVVGTDAPGLCAEKHISAAFHALESEQADLVIGPAKDGGYYLLGMQELHRNVFEGIQWSTSTVFCATMEKARAMALKVMLLEMLPDVDTPDDLDVWRAAASSA
ncbi:hypothetical protein FVE85_6531 [Porphyridium purpureum]|uniref:Glycosyltransferase n=1 Tax=Porphyridium purpureum TaxID=35688 RepID=A0A5J4Z5E6_PORPP|nr:hypothetical protein FVE85_6531 [Porphyridium purpureum]|eukprot:POR1539..scf295_1